MISKLKNTAGDSISEVLVATLVSALGALLFATMAVTSTKIAQTGIDKMAEYADLEETLELNTKLDGSNPAAKSIKVGGKQFTIKSATVNVYGDSTENIYSYTVKLD